MPLVSRCELGGDRVRGTRAPDSGCSPSRARAAGRACRRRSTGRSARPWSCTPRGRAPRRRTRSAVSGCGCGRWERCELALERERRRVSAAGTSEKSVSSVAGCTSGSRARSWSRSDTVATSGDQSFGVASTTPRGCRRRFVGDLGERGEHALRSQRRRTRDCRTSARGALSVATAGVGVPRLVVNVNGCAGVSGSGDRRERGVAHDEAADEHLREPIERGASSTGSTNAVRGSGISPVASLDGVRARDELLGQVRAEALGLDASGRRSARTARGGSWSSSARSRAAHAFGRRARARRGFALRRSRRRASRARCRASAGSCPRVRAASRCGRGGRRAASPRASTGRHAVGELERIGSESARSTRRAAVATRSPRCGSTTTIHVTNVLCVDLVPSTTDLDGIHAGAVDADRCAAPRSRSARTPTRKSCCGLSWSRREREREPCDVVPASDLPLTALSKSVREVTERWIVSWTPAPGSAATDGLVEMERDHLDALRRDPRRLRRRGSRRARPAWAPGPVWWWWSWCAVAGAARSWTGRCWAGRWW